MKKRDYAIDFIRLVAILAVVAIHTSTYFLDRTDYFSFNFYVLHAINQLFRFAVPAFFAISGYLLASHYSNISNPINFYKKRFGKIILPYFSWSLIYFLFIFPNPANLVFSHIFVHDLLTGDASYQLYFIPAIIILYLIFPLLIKFKKIFLTNWFIIFLFIVEAIIQSYVYFFEPRITLISDIPIAFYNLLPFLIGIYAAINIRDIRMFIEEKLKIFELIAALMWFILIFESVYMFIKTASPSYLRDQWRISVPIFGISMSSIFYYFYQERWNKTISYLSSFSLGVFFVHAAILHNVLLFVFHYKLYDLFSFIISLSIIITLSFLFSIIFSKTPLLNKILGLRA